MFKLRIYCNDGDYKYWEEINKTYETYEKALVACYQIALNEVQGLMETSDYYNWFEVNTDFEITETYKNKELKDVKLFPVSTIHYDHAPWDRENDCDITIITGYYIVEI